MPALMPRCTDCVLCGEPIKGRGRIDRIYCSASCRTLAWRARAGHQFEGSRKPKLPPQPGDFIARKALPLLAMRMRAELTAAQQRIAELEERFAGQRGGSSHADSNVAVGVAAAVGAIGIAAALRRRRHRRQQAEPERASDVVDAEQQSHQAEMTAEQPRAVHREAELQEQITSLTARAEQAEAREQAAVACLSTLQQDVEALRHEVSQNESNIQKMHLDMTALQGALSEAYNQSRRLSEGLLKESQQCQHLQLQLREARRGIKVQQQELDETDAKLTEESQQREHLQLQLTTVQKQLGAERRQWQDARALLTQHAQEEQSQLVTDNRRLRYLLAEMESCAQVTAGTIPERQDKVGSQEPRSLEKIEEIQRKQLPDSQPEPKVMSSPKEPRRLVSGLSTVGLLMTLGAVKSAANATALPDRKRLPPKRD